MRNRLTGKIILILFVGLLYWVISHSNRWISDNRLKAMIVPKMGSSVLTPLNSFPKTAGDNNAVFYKEDIVNAAADYKTSHVSSLAWLGEGRIACVWYGGSREGARNVKIYFSIYDENSGVWSEEMVIVSRESSSDDLDLYVRKVGNPVIFSDSEGRLWLFYVTIAVGGWSGSSLNYKISYDNGKTWTPSKKLILSPFFNLSNLVKNKPVLLQGGGFLLPVYHEFINKFAEVLMVVPDRDDARYKKWRMGFKQELLQPSIIALDERIIAAYFRNSGKVDRKYVMESISNDGGATWSDPLPTTLPNPDSGLDAVQTYAGKVLIALNDSFKDRSRLALYISKNTNKDWVKIKDLEDAPDMEFSYPSIILTPDNVYHITYTHDRKFIKHISFSEAWLSGRNKNDFQ